MDPAILDGISHVGASIGLGKVCPDDDFVDRVNHIYTMNLLMFFIAIVLSRQLVGKPISCWIPNDFTGAQGEYAETVCWVTSTYFIAPNQATVPIQEDLRYKKTVYYYQWVPFILMIQAAFFVVPCIIWRLFNSQSRINLRTVMDVSRELKNLTESLEQRRDLINCLVRHLEDALAMRHYNRQKRQRRPCPTDQTEYGKDWALFAAASAGHTNDSRGARFSTPVIPLTFSRQKRVPGPRPCNPASSSYLCGLYLIIKMLYLVNSTAQLFITGNYLSGNNFLFGLTTLIDLLNTRFWDHTGSFPRVALCDFELRRMGSNQHRYTIQCVLRVNIFNEKIYIFLWFWFFLMSVINAFSLLKWIYKLFFPSVRLDFVRNLICIYLNIHGMAKQSLGRNDSSNSASNNCKQEETELSIADCFKTTKDKATSKIFTEDILGQDGILVLRFVSMNVGPAAAAELIGVIWTKYRRTATLSDPLDTPLEQIILPPIPPKKTTRPTHKTKAVKPSPSPSITLRTIKSRALAHRGDSDDHSSGSSRPTIENIHRRHYRRHHRRRDSYYSDDKNSFQPSMEDQILETDVDYVPE